MLRKSLFLLMSVIPLVWGCNKEENVLTIESEPETETTVDEEVTSYPGVDPLLWEYYERFEEEALERGIEIDLKANNITGVIENIGEDDVAGQCSFNPTRPNHVTIDLGFWTNAGNQAREFVVFHELGHCELLREHREATHPNGTCQSIMRSGLGTCRDNYNVRTREEYLDELFDPNFANQIQ